MRVADLKHHRRGRGAGINPANRFDRLSVELDPSELEEGELRTVPTQYLTDASRSVLSENSSPDVPFRYSLNPYRGCEHGCVYCLDPGTPVLMADSSAKAIADLVPGDEIVGTQKVGAYRRFVNTRVFAHWWTRKPAYEVGLADGTSIVASGDHRFLTERGWKYVTGAMAGPGRRPYLTTNNRLMGVGELPRPMGDPAIYRKRSIAGKALKTTDDLRVVSITPVGERDLVDITTGTSDFIANGLVSHNCYARPSHEYLGFSAGLDFESRIVVKHDAPRLLAETFERPSWQPQVVALSGNTDAYQPVERKLKLTRRCLEVFHDYRNPVAIITKNHLVTRDLDLLGDLASLGAASVFVSITSLKDEVTGKMEPRTSRVGRRLEAIRALSEAGVPTGVMVAPVIPGLTDEEMPAILEAAREAGAQRAAYIVVRLPGTVSHLFEEWLKREYPDRAAKVINRVRSLREGKLNHSDFGVRMRGTGQWAELFSRLFRMTTDRLGFDRQGPPLNAGHFRRRQGELF